MVEVAKIHLFPWIRGVLDCPQNRKDQGGFICRKSVSAARYIAAFVNNTKGLQWIGATIVISNCRPKKIPPLAWRECIKKVWEIDPLLCSHSGGLMKIVSFIYEHRVIKEILAHLGLLRRDKVLTLLAQRQFVGFSVKIIAKAVG